MPRTLRTRDDENRPFLEIRLRGLHLTVQHVPYRLVTLITTVCGAAAGAVWYPR
ncbi:hypothetical protein ACGFXC_21260 [Streptomyces sp. NPDC048507]|uniref:hypothetical protein n=1 Tax=Streptomyces sp. NPDC048507 TaxID=3365560 RepID=UPI0037177A19